MANQYDIYKQMVQGGFRSPRNMVNYQPLTTNQMNDYRLTGLLNNMPSPKASTQANNRPNTYMSPNMRSPAPMQNKTPPNFRDNLLNYVLSPSGQGMTQGLLEASKYSTMPVGMGEAFAQGLKRSNEFQRYEDAKNFREEQFDFLKETKGQELGLKEKQIDATLEAARLKKKSFVPLSKEQASQLGLDPEKSYQIETGSNEIKQVGGGGTTINMPERVGIEKEKSALKLVESDYEKFKNASSNRVAIEQMRSASDSFKTGAFADTRIFIGQAGDLIGIDAATQSALFNPASGEAFKSAQNKLVRQLADGLLNLNRQELVMLQDNYPKVSNTREGNQLLFNIYDQEYQSQEKQLALISQYYSTDMSMADYNKAQQKIKNDYSEQVKTMLDEYTGGLDNFKNLMMNNVGKTGSGINSSGNTVDIAVEKTDKFIGLNENGMPTYQKIGGVQYTIIDEE
nr:hypothetical protein [uncultured Mediterranean phage uvMED]